MALFIRQDNDRSELQKRLAAELQERAKKRAALQDRPDGIEDSQFIQGTKRTTTLALTWVILIAIAAGLFIWLTILNTNR